MKFLSHMPYCSYEPSSPPRPFLKYLGQYTKCMPIKRYEIEKGIGATDPGPAGTDPRYTSNSKSDCLCRRCRTLRRSFPEVSRRSSHFKRPQVPKACTYRAYTFKTSAIAGTVGPVSLNFSFSIPLCSTDMALANSQSQRSKSSLEKTTDNELHVEDTTNGHASDPNYKFNEAKLKPRTTPAERSALLKEALKVDPGVKPWSWRAIQTIFIVLVTCCCK